jgi:hypothetical protein
MYQDMNAAQVDYSIGQDRSWEKQIILKAVSISDWIIIPEKIKIIDVTVSFTGGASGKIQTSTDLVDTVKNGSPVPIDWPFGTVSSDQSRSCKPVTAMRAVQEAAGEMKLTMRVH